MSKEKLAVLKSDQYYYYLYDNYPDILITINKRGRVIDINTTATKLLGYKKEEVLGKSFRLFVPRKYYARIIKDLALGFLGINTPALEVEVKDKKGDLIPFEFTYQEIPVYEGKKITSLVLTGRDIRERKGHLEEIYKQKILLQNYLELAANIVLVLDVVGNIVYINKKGLEILEYTNEELLGKNWFTTCLLNKEIKQTKEVFTTVKSGDLSYEYHDNFIKTKTGQEKLIRWHNTTLKNEKGEIVSIISSGEDITAIREYENILQLQHELAIFLGTTADLKLSLQKFLDILIEIAQADSGGVYFYDQDKKGLVLLNHTGLRPNFIKAASFYSESTPQFKLVNQGKPVYALHEQVLQERTAVDEQLKAIAILPVMYENNLLAVVNLASHTKEEIPLSSRSFLEDIILNLAGVISRLITEENFKKTALQYKSTLQALTDILFVVGEPPHYPVVLFNAAFQKFILSLGFDVNANKNSLFLKKVCELLKLSFLHTDEEYFQIFEKQKESFTEKILEINGSQYIFEMRQIPIMEKGRTIQILTIMHDITYKRQYEQKLEKTLAQIKEKETQLEALTQHFVGRELKMLELKKKLQKKEEDNL